jgi:hypothetical protein
MSLISCGGGGGGNTSAPNSSITPPPPTPVTYQINGAGIKGPLTNAMVRVYSFDSASESGLGELIDEGSTNDMAQITDLSITGDLAEYYVLVFESTESTVDISTQLPPIISSFSTLVSSDNIRAGNNNYASPLSSLVFEVMLNKISQGNSITEAIDESELLVKSIFGLGTSTEISVLNSPALLTETTQTFEQQVDVFNLRKAIEVFAILTFQLTQSIAAQEIVIEDLITHIAMDILDGKLDAISSEETNLPYSLDNLSIFQQPVNDLVVINSNNLRIGLLAEELVNESKVLLEHELNTEQLISDLSINKYNYVMMTIDIDNDGIINIEDIDDDNDGVSDKADAFPTDPSEFEDYDYDGVGNQTDLDDDNDGVLDEADPFPLDESEWLDTDLDGTGTNADNDDDNDSYFDDDDKFPLDKTEWFDTDEDGIGNNTDNDDDNDGYIDNDDQFPLNEFEWLDTDNDGIGNNTDSDDDNDGVYDNDDDLPLDPTESIDFDKDGIGDISDNDDDNDGIVDTSDNIHVSAPNKSTLDYSEEIKFNIRGFFTDGTVLDASDKWHIQYGVYDKEMNEKRIPYYSENGYYNASFDHDKKEWQVAFPAPDYSGEFEVEFSLYCSSAENICGGHNTSGSNYFSHKQKASFSVTCSSDVCGYTPDPEPGKNITASEVTDFITTSVVRSNGDVIAIYRHQEPNNWRSYVVRSTNKGYTWSIISRLPNMSYYAEILETQESKELVVFADCGSTTFCVYQSTEGENWTTSKQYPYGFANCTGDDCNRSNIIVRDFFEKNDGKFNLIFNKKVGDKSITFSSTSENLNAWSTPVDLFNNNTKTRVLSYIQIDDGRFLAQVIDNEVFNTSLRISEDGLNWETIKTNGYFDDAKLVYKEGKLRLFYQTDNKLYEIGSSNLTNFTAPQLILDKSYVGFDIVEYTNGSLGIIYNLHLNYQYDVFYENLEITMP